LGQLHHNWQSLVICGHLIDFKSIPNRSPDGSIDSPGDRVALGGHRAQPAILAGGFACESANRGASVAVWVCVVVGVLSFALVSAWVLV
jgi:hypothetical protein